LVNGVKQSDELHKEIYEKYGKKPGAMTFGYATDYSKSNSYNSSNSTSGSNSNSYSNSGTDPARGTYSNSYSGTYPNSPSPKYSTPPAPKHSTPPSPKYSNPNAPVYTNQERNNETVREILADLEKDGLISNRNHISFQISGKEFTLNGKKQSEEVFQKYKKKYAPENGGNNWTWSHSYNNDITPE
jgi:hypothetical protein